MAPIVCVIAYRNITYCHRPNLSLPFILYTYAGEFQWGRYIIANLNLPDPGFDIGVAGNNRSSSSAVFVDLWGVFVFVSGVIISAAYNN